MKANKLWSIIMMIVMTLSVAVTLSSCDDPDDSTSSKVIKGYYYKNGGEYSSIMLYFDGKGNGVKYTVWESRDEVKVGTFGGVTYYSNNLDMESFIYYFVENVIKIVGVKGYTETLHVNNGVIDGYVSADKIAESENYNFVGRTFYNGSGQDMSNSTITFMTEKKCKIHAFGYEWVAYVKPTRAHKEYYDWTEECEYYLDTHHKKLVINNSPFLYGGGEQEFIIRDYGIESRRDIWYNTPQY